MQHLTATGPDPVTARAEEVREATGCPWEEACRIAERERDAREMGSDQVKAALKRGYYGR